MLRVQLFPYCYRDPQTGKWVRAPHPAELQQIIARYADWVLVGPHEIREVELEAPESEPQRRDMGRFDVLCKEKTIRKAAASKRRWMLERQQTRPQSTPSNRHARKA